MSPYLLGIDSGLTVTKAVVFDEDGRQRGVGAVNNAHKSPHPRWVEQDMDRLWESCYGAIRQALDEAGIGGGDIAAVGVSGHGDGIYLVDEEGRPVRAGVLSLDSRAYKVLERWQESGVTDRALELTGQKPFASLAATLLTWFKGHEPESFERTRWILYVKDWLRYKLTGEYATDPTEASSGFTDVNTQEYSPEVLSLYGLEEVQGKLPPVVACTGVVGEVTREAAEATGLAGGTPVVSGAHDIDACPVGVGCTKPGQLTMIAGTWSINGVISDRPVLNEAGLCRNFVVPGLWANFGASPASATNLEWFVQRLSPLEVEKAKNSGTSPFAFVNEEVKEVLGEESRVFYHPFLYGSPYGDAATAGFFGLRGWHTRGHVLRALFEGVVFNHKWHVDTLRSVSDFTRVRLTGGGSRSELWSQMFADALNLAVEVPDADEAGALGAAVCAGVGADVYRSLDEATERTVRLLRTHEPDSENHQRLTEAYETYTAIAEALTPVWPRMG
jgi:L-xylulokinase